MSNPESEEYSEVYEMTAEEWEAAIDQRLQELGLTREELTRKHDDHNLSVEEFKVWMLM